jgi:hypothetical protein
MKWSLLPLAARRECSSEETTSRIAARNRRSYSEEKPKPRSVVTVFPAAMEIIHAGYWKISSRGAINEYHRLRFLSNNAQARGYHSIAWRKSMVVEKKSAPWPADRRAGLQRSCQNGCIRAVRIPIRQPTNDEALSPRIQRIG